EQEEPHEQTVEHVPSWEESSENVVAPAPARKKPAAAPPPPRALPPEPSPAIEPPPASRYVLPEAPPRMHRAPRPDTSSYLAVIRVVGVGGAGLNALHRMMDAGISQVEFVAVNTDIQQLQMSDAQTKIHIGRELTQGLGSGSDPDIGRRAVQGICDLITMPGLINLDVADVRTIMKDAGSALMGIGFSSSDENRAREAAERALRSPLIETELMGAKGILLSIAGGGDLSLIEVNEAAEVIRQAATDDTNIIFGATIDESLAGQVWVTVVATGLGAPRRPVYAGVRSPDDLLAPPSFLSE